MEWHWGSRHLPVRACQPLISGSLALFALPGPRLHSPVLVCGPLPSFLPSPRSCPDTRTLPHPPPMLLLLLLPLLLLLARVYVLVLPSPLMLSAPLMLLLLRLQLGGCFSCCRCTYAPSRCCRCAYVCPLAVVAARTCALPLLPLRIRAPLAVPALPLPLLFVAPYLQMYN
jgi:hypothetical protein